MMIRSMLCVFFLAGLGLAQEQQQSAPVASGGMPSGVGTNKSGPGSEPWRRMSVKEKLHYDARHVLDADNLIFAGVGAAFDQARDRPGQWGQGWGAFSERYASHVGQYLVQRSIMYPVQAMDGEDTRYLRSKRTHPTARLGDAFLHTIWRRADSGGMMPAYSELFGDYGAAAISRLWWPSQYHKGSSIFIAGSNTILIDGAINAFHEFTPDIKRVLHIRP